MVPIIRIALPVSSLFEPGARASERSVPVADGASGVESSDSPIEIEHPRVVPVASSNSEATDFRLAAAMAMIRLAHRLAVQPWPRSARSVDGRRSPW